MADGFTLPPDFIRKLADQARWMERNRAKLEVLLRKGSTGWGTILSSSGEDNYCFVYLLAGLDGSVTTGIPLYFDPTLNNGLGGLYTGENPLTYYCIDYTTSLPDGAGAGAYAWCEWLETESFDWVLSIIAMDCTS